MRDIAFCRGDQEHELGDIDLVSSRMDGENVLNLNASFADVEVSGEFLPTRLPRTIENVIYSVFPSLKPNRIFGSHWRPRIPDRYWIW